MNEQSINLLKKIEDAKPDVVAISGCVDPTYYSYGFYEVLIPEKSIQFGLRISKSELFLDKVKIGDWILNTVEKINPSYEIVKVKNIYIVGEYDFNEDLEELIDENGNAMLDYGGIIELIYFNKNIK